MAHHAQLGQGESNENVDAVKHHEETDRSARYGQNQHGGATHEQNAVLRNQPVAQRSKTRGKPPVNGHTGKDPGTIQEAGLGRNK